MAETAGNKADEGENNQEDGDSKRRSSMPARFKGKIHYPMFVFKGEHAPVVFWRKPRDWALTIVIFTGLYIVMILLWTIAYMIVYNFYIPDPKNGGLPIYSPGTGWKHNYFGYIGTSPGVSLRPQVSTDKITYLAVYDVANSEKREKYDQDLKDYVAKEAPPGYESSLGEAASINVQKSAKHSRREAFGWTNQSMVSVIGSGVKFDASAGCGGLGFGFANKQPCFLIRPGRIFNWVPETFDNFEEMEKHMPKRIPKEYFGVAATSMVPGVLWVACYPYAGESLIEKIVYVGPSVGGKNVNGFPVKGFFPVKPRTGTEQRAAEAAGKGPHAPMPYMYLKVYLKQQREGTFKSDTEERQVEIQCYQLAKNVPLDLTRRSGMNIFTILAAGYSVKPFSIGFLLCLSFIPRYFIIG